MGGASGRCLNIVRKFPFELLGQPEKQLAEFRLARRRCGALTL